MVSFHDPYYKIIYSDGDEEEMTRSSVLKYLVDLENNNAKVGLRKRKEVVIGTNSGLFPIDIFWFVFYEREIEVDIQTGSLIA